MNPDNPEEMEADNSEVCLAMLKTFLRGEQHSVAAKSALHAILVRQDPGFYGRMAVWYHRNGEHAGHKEMFVGSLLSSDLAEHRDAGFVLLQELPPGQVARVIACLKRVHGKVPRAARTAVRLYLRQFEADPAAFDRVAVRAAKALKGLYAGLHIRPSARADAILFKNVPPADSLVFKLRKVDKCRDPAEQARLLVKYEIPFAVAISAMEKLAPAVLAALLHVMTPSEILRNLEAIERHAALQHSEVRAIVDAKLALQPVAETNRSPSRKPKTERELINEIMCTPLPVREDGGHSKLTIQ